MSDQPLDQSMLREHLIKAIVSEVPFVGKVINEMVFEVKKSVLDAQSKAKLDEAIAQIHTELKGQNTDIGDLLLRQEQHLQLTQEIRDALVMLALYMKQQADTNAVSQVERAASKVLVAEEKAAGGTVVNRIELLQKLTSLTTPQVDMLFGAISGAARYDASTQEVPSRVVKLINYVESGVGPGLETLIVTAKGLFPTLFPQ